jgi:hypothetical protein
MAKPLQSATADPFKAKNTRQSLHAQIKKEL